MVTTRSARALLDAGVQPPGQHPANSRKAKENAGKHHQPQKGALSGIMGVPIEVFTEVMSYLLPLDILHLARSTKAIRSMLMHKKARVTWLRSFRNLPTWSDVPFPDCPPDLSEPEYASLIFDKWCLNCSKRQVSRVDLFGRLRACKSCANPIESHSDVKDFAAICGIEGEISQETLSIYNLIPPLDEGDGAFSPQVALEIYKKCMVQKARLTPLAYSEYLKKQADMKPHIQNNALQLQKWVQRCADSRKLVEQTFRNNRNKDVWARLLQAGVDAIDSPSVAYRTHGFSATARRAWDSLVYQADPITEESWQATRAQLEYLLARNEGKYEDPYRSLEQRFKESKEFYATFLEVESLHDAESTYPLPEEASSRVIGAKTWKELKTVITQDKWDTQYIGPLRDFVVLYQRDIRRVLAGLARGQLWEWSYSASDCQVLDWPLKRTVPFFDYNGERRTERDLIIIEDDEANTTFLTRDPTRMIFSSRLYPEIQKHYPDIAAVEQDWRSKNLRSRRLVNTAPFGHFMTCRIEDYGKFTLVDGIWT